MTPAGAIILYSCCTSLQARRAKASDVRHRHPPLPRSGPGAFEEEEVSAHILEKKPVATTTNEEPPQLENVLRADKGLEREEIQHVIDPHRRQDQLFNEVRDPSSQARTASPHARQ